MPCTSYTFVLGKDIRKFVAVQERAEGLAGGARGRMIPVELEVAAVKQGVFEHLPTALHAGLRSAQRKSKPPGDLFLLDALQLVEGERFAVRAGEPVHHSPQ